MVVFNPSKKEIGAKIVYYGPAAGGKTTNLRFIYSRMNPNQRGELISLATKDDRTLFFDFLPLDLGTVKGFNVRFHLYTVPGQVYYVSTRRAVLTGVDGVVFVADSQEEKLAENIESLEDLEKNLFYYGKKIDEIPMVFQYNKRDLEKISSIKGFNTKLNRGNLSFFEAVALNGKGVMECLTFISKEVLKNLEDPFKKPKVKRSAPPTSLKRGQKPESPKSPPPLAKNEEETFIELGSDERAFDIEKLRAERRATIDRLLKQKELGKDAVESFELEPAKVSERLGVEKTIELDGTEEIDRNFTEEDFENGLDISEESFEPEKTKDEKSDREGETTNQFIEEAKEISPASVGGADLAEDAMQTEIDEIPLELEDSQEEWVDFETEGEELDEAEKKNKKTKKSLPKTGGIEIVSCGKPEKILPASIKLPLVVKLTESNKETKIDITIHLEELL